MRVPRARHAMPSSAATGRPRLSSRCDRARSPMRMPSRISRARSAFEATLKKEPNRLGATLGAAKAAEKAGDAAKAAQHYRAAVALTESADPVRTEIAAARAYLAKQN